MATWYVQQDGTGEYGYELRGGKLYYIERDKDTNSSSEEEVGVDEFLKHYGSDSQEPYPQIIAALKAL